MVGSADLQHPRNWSIHRDSDGHRYLSNVEQHVSMWEDEFWNVPGGWTSRYNDQGDIYFVHEQTATAQWNHPRLLQQQQQEREQLERQEQQKTRPEPQPQQQGQQQQGQDQGRRLGRSAPPHHSPCD
eukprot:GEMP01114961.1.p1 GENE.GEMP01114961.1~~GEMP01114961.1.p1  ORF type:complete len:127 (+),score=24.13 GEMP01114961.1:91-471(+)